MTRAQIAPLIGPEFDPFLTASIGDPSDGQSLSVLSAFARTDLDPWQEAASLAKTSREKAIVRMTDFLSAMSDRPAAEIPAQTVARRLVALLPNKANAKPQGPSKLRTKVAASDAYANLGLGFSAIAFLIVLALIAAAEPKAGSQGGGKPAAPVETSTAQPIVPYQ